MPIFLFLMSVGLALQSNSSLLLVSLWSIRYYFCCNVFNWSKSEFSGKSLGVIFPHFQSVLSLIASETRVETHNNSNDNCRPSIIPDQNEMHFIFFAFDSAQISEWESAKSTCDTPFAFKYYWRTSKGSSRILSPIRLTKLLFQACNGMAMCRSRNGSGITRTIWKWLWV